MTFAALSDLNQPYSCTAWGDLAPSGAGMIVEDTGYGMHNLFNNENAFPSFAFVDHNMTVHYKSNSAGTWMVKNKIQDMLDVCIADGLCGSVDSDNDGLIEDDNCPNDYNPNQNDDDGDGIGDECDDCHNLLGDLDDNSTHDILDIVLLVNIILDGGLTAIGYTDCEKGDADLDGNGLANILDIIQLINLIMDNRIVDSSRSGNASIDYQIDTNDLYVNINSDKDFSGVQLSIKGDYSNIDLLNNSHIQLESRIVDGITRMIAYSILNDSFDGHNAKFVIENGAKLGMADIDVIVSDRSGDSMIITQSLNADIYQSGPHKFEFIIYLS